MVIRWSFDPLQYIRKAAQEKVIVFCLLPNTTHLTQPLEKGVFGPLKEHRAEQCHHYMTHNPAKVVTQYEFMQLIGVEMVLYNLRLFVYMAMVVIFVICLSHFLFCNNTHGQKPKPTTTTRRKAYDNQRQHLRGVSGVQLHSIHTQSILQCHSMSAAGNNNCTQVMAINTSLQVINACLLLFTNFKRGFDIRMVLCASVPSFIVRNANTRSDVT